MLRAFTLLALVQSLMMAADADDDALKVDTWPTYACTVGEEVKVDKTFSGEGHLMVDPLPDGVSVSTLRMTLCLGFLDDGTVISQERIYVTGKAPGNYDISVWFADKDGKPRKSAIRFHLSVRVHNDRGNMPVFRGDPDPAINTGP